MLFKSCFWFSSTLTSSTTSGEKMHKHQIIRAEHELHLLLCLSSGRPVAGVPVLGSRRPGRPPRQRALCWPGGGGGRLRPRSSTFWGLGAERRLQRRSVCHRVDGAGGRLQVRARLVQLHHCQSLLWSVWLRVSFCSPAAQNISTWTWEDYSWFVTGNSTLMMWHWWRIYRCGWWWLTANSRLTQTPLYTLFKVSHMWPDIESCKLVLTRFWSRGQWFCSWSWRR